MKDKTKVLCPLKGTFTYKWVCTDRCTADKAKCVAARDKMKEEVRFCIDCRSHGQVHPCKNCMRSFSDYRDRPFWMLSPKRPEF